MYGFSNSSVSWFRSYLLNRFQLVDVNGTFSDKLEINIGVPQGSILGPLLFILYINDIVGRCNHAQIDMYADDTTVAVADRNIDVIDWFCRNKLSLNADKTQVMLIGTKQNISRNAKFTKLHVSVNDIVLEEVESAKLLGVYVNKYLDWKCQLEKLCNKISKKLGLLRRLKHVVPQASLIKLFNSIILPNFDYCDVIWSTCGLGTLHTLEMLQKQAARILLSARRYTHSQPLFSKLKWMTLKKRIDYHRAVLLFKCMNNLCPPYLCVLFQEVNTIHSRVTRNTVGNKLYIPFSKLEYGKRRFSIRGALEWNYLPDYIKNASSIGQFKSLYLDYSN